MKIKVITLVGAITALSSVYACHVLFENKVRNLAFETQVEPSFYQRQLITDATQKDNMTLPQGKYEYTYYYEPDSIIKTIWTFSGDGVEVKGYLVNYAESQIDNRSPNYQVRAKAHFQGSVIVFSELSGHIGLLPKYGLAIKEIHDRHLVLDTSDNSYVTMQKYGSY
ncbi:hypothetical protein DC915_RS02880 [Vibrio parahaemolyticus]|jgi:hypothetical protein|uniref:Uncharacterized protein n=1 Tax=Vibrio jasicida TaxID=766224 RepID=A0AAU9QTN1_9VIBR|nr:hypothetical protein [Vibrio parahaemolyticus]EJG0009923.1 hypothetical protein [Vibrio parahaemolyticus]ELA8176751.1 hypothetical protein [Vibrio alginolyticus]CAH1598897.1 exported hypothetical protein [Vibrio jasicida]CAH1601438.1 exported hypothetical protein [Vibrio jasicida]